jgi:hypothetical protein
MRSKTPRSILQKSLSDLLILEDDLFERMDAAVEITENLAMACITLSSIKKDVLFLFGVSYFLLLISQNGPAEYCFN